MFTNECSYNHFKFQRLTISLTEPADYWVGGTDWEIEGEWIWEGSQKNVTYTHWLPGQPNNGRAPLANPTSGNAEFQNCLSLRYQDDFRWVDSVCAEHLHYVCEKQ